MTTDRIRVIANAYICQVDKILAAIFFRDGYYHYLHFTVEENVGERCLTSKEKVTGLGLNSGPLAPSLMFNCYTKLSCPK